MNAFFWTPHSGYHWDGSRRRFFEGWYFRLTLPEVKETFAFMYSIDDPAGNSALSGGAAQVLGPGEGYLYCPFPDISQFWAWPHRLGLGHWQQAGTTPVRCLPAASFWATVRQGYQVTATQHQGCVQDLYTGAIARWDYQITPVYGWGQGDSPPLATTGWLSYLPWLEPGWQVLMAHGLATGWAEWQDQRYEFTAAPVYAEKNWGGAFPERWFWIQCNAFDGSTDLALTAVGARRQLLGQPQTVGMIGLHWQGQALILTTLHHSLRWSVQPWGHWSMTAYNHRYRVVLQGIAAAPPVQVRVPTHQGLQFACWDTTHGQVEVTVWRRSPKAADTLMLNATSHLAGLEVGGTGWETPWEYFSPGYPQALRHPLAAISGSAWFGLPASVAIVDGGTASGRLSPG